MSDVSAYVQRLIGWSDGRAIERALALLRAHANGAPLVMLVDDDGPALARELHRRSGDARPFVAIERRSVGDFAATARDLGGSGGVLCMWASHAPRGLATACLETPGLRVVLCYRALHEPSALVMPVLRVPRFKDRGDERHRIVREFEDDARSALGVPADTALSEFNRQRIATRGLSYGELAYVIERLMLLRAWGTVATARRLGVTAAAISQWHGRWVRRAP